KTMQYLQLLKEKQVDGMIFTSETLKEEYYNFIKEMEIPMVLLSSESYDFPVPFVKVNDQHAAYSATEYLIKKGHEKIGMISGNANDPVAGLPRINGVKQAMQANNFPVHDHQIVVETGFGFEDGINGFHRLIKQFPDITAIFAASDEIALGVISAAYQLNVKVPDDISLIGYDNLSIAEMSTPPLTSVHQPLYDMGAKATELVFEMINQPEKLVESRIFQHEIKERDSVKDLSSN
ncbi:LacI family transcriptional regulator, partial [Gracilibacillus halophilus YIM-C55.5]